MSLLAVLLLTYRQSLPNYISSSLFAIMVLAFISLKLVFFLRGVDVLSYTERDICYVFFGGLVDDLQNYFLADEQTDRPEQ